MSFIPWKYQITLQDGRLGCHLPKTCVKNSSESSKNFSRCGIITHMPRINYAASSTSIVDCKSLHSIFSPIQRAWTRNFQIYPNLSSPPWCLQKFRTSSQDFDKPMWQCGAQSVRSATCSNSQLSPAGEFWVGKTSWWETRKALWNETLNCARSSFLSGLKPKLWKKKMDFELCLTKKTWQVTRITCNMMQPMPASFAHQLSHWEFHAETSKRCKVQLWEVVFCLTNSPYLNRLADDQKLNRKQKAEVKKSRTIPKLKTLSNSGKLPYICNMTTRATFRQWQGAAMTASTACCLKPRWDCEFSQQGNPLRLHIWQCQPTVLFVKCSLE